MSNAKASGRAADYILDGEYESIFYLLEYNLMLLLILNALVNIIVGDKE